MLNETLINRYHLEAQLGEGGMGVVYRAQDLLLKRNVAVKVLSNTALGAEGRARLLSEAQAVAALNHPNIVTVYDAGATGEAPFIVMELVQGTPLSQVTLPGVSEVLDVIRQVCVALEHAHANGVIHRDLKLENVLITQNRTVKLMDFGLARLRDTPRLTQTGMLLGTFLYMAPELLMGQEASIQSDLYALGVMFYELACGNPPFRGDDPLGIVSQHLHATPVPPSTYNPAIPPEIETIMLHLLSKQPSDRPASAMDVRHSLERASQVGKAPVEGHTSLDRVVRGRMVGREREMEEILAQWHKTTQGDSGILLISGEPGVGKSRLIRELVVQAQVESSLPLVGECYAEGGAPYNAFAQMILNASDWPSDLSTLVLADLISLAPALRVRYPDTPLNPALEPQAEQQRLYESAFTFFARLASRAPLLLALEDVHWADGGTLALARSLARRFYHTHTPVLMALTYREGELTGQKGLNDLLTTWGRERKGLPLKLRRLDRPGTQEMLAALFSEPVSTEFADGVYHETEGNPFFIEELCKALIGDGQVYRENGRWQRRSTSSIELPRSIRIVIETRLARLPANTQEVLHLAAVLGRRFEFDVLRCAVDPNAGQAEDALITALESAEQAQLLFEVGREGGGTFEFAHALIPTTLNEALSGMRRRRLHQRAALALEKLHPEDEKALAHHWLEAGQDQRALDFLIQAGQHAQAAYANAEAVADYQQAIGLLHELHREPAQNADWQVVETQLLERLGDVLELSGQHDQAWGAYRDALALVPESETLRRSGLFRKMGKTRENMRQYDEAGQIYLQSESALGAMPSEHSAEWWQEWISLQLDRMYLYYWLGRVEEMLEMVEQVRPAVEQYGDPRKRGLFYTCICLMMLRRDRYVVSDELLAYTHKALDVLKEGSSGTEYYFAEFALGFTLLWRGELDEAEKQLKRSLQLCARTGDVTIETRTLIYLTIVYRKRGDVENVKSYAARSLEAAAIGQMIEYTSMGRANQAWVARREGHLDAARSLLEEAWGVMKQVPQGQMFAWVWVWPLIAISISQTRIDEAVEYARLLFGPKTKPQPESIAVLLQDALLAWEQGEAGQAQAKLDQAASLAERMGYI